MTTSAAGASGGFRDAMSCDVCTELYEQSIRTPLVLPCGHTFCRPCLTDIKKKGSFHCPTCRAGHNNLQVEALTVNYSLLNILALCNQFEYDKCATHGDDLRYWCANCDQSLCCICLYSGHPQGHTVKLAQTFVTEKKQKLEERINAVFKNINEHKNELKKGFNNVDALVMQLFRKNVHFHNTEMAVKDLLDDIKKANGIASVLSYEKLVGEFQSKKNLADPGEEKARERTDPSVDTQDKVKNLPAKDKDALLVTTKDLKEAASESTAVANTAAGTDPNWRAMMDYCDGRLLLHTLSNPTTTRMSMQMPHEVFLELGVGDKCLGRVYIRLWCHLCRAQQLLALCMGTMGPSLLKAKASDKMGNLIVFRSAVDRNNKSVSNALLTGLEWGGQHTKPETEGLVTGIVSNNLAFGICIQKQTGVSVNAAFGVVVAGHEVTKAAFQHNPVSEVTITSCGLVMPGFSQEG